MSAIPSWRAGFELEVILGDLGDPRFERELRDGEAMDEASPTFCRAFASKLRERTRRAWSAPTKSPQRPGFYVVPEYGLDRSEEHTSELQSLMRISYAVFCLKKK